MRIIAVSPMLTLHIFLTIDIVHSLRSGYIPSFSTNNGSQFNWKSDLVPESFPGVWFLIDTYFRDVHHNLEELQLSHRLPGKKKLASRRKMALLVQHCRVPLRAHCYFHPNDQTINVTYLTSSQKRAHYTNEKLRPMATILRPVLKKFLADM